MKLSVSHLLAGAFLLLPLASVLQAQVIEPAPGQSLTITEDVNLNADKVLRSAGVVLLKPSSLSLGNLALGLQAGSATTTAINNTFLGTAAGLNSTGSANTFVGFSAGRANTTGQFNTFLGVQAGINNTTGNANFIMGTNAGANNTTGSANFFLGDNAGANNSSGGYNVYLGANAGNGTGVNGDNNVSIGFESGRTNQNGVNNTFIGFRADAGAAGLNNATAIGNNAKVTQSNAVVLGNGANVGIGNTAPSARLHITSGQTGQSGLRLENLTSSSTAPTNSSKFLTVDGSGNVILANYAGGGRQGAEEADVLWQRKGGFLQSTRGEAIVIGANLSKTPVGYRLFVQDGILTEKVKVAVKNTSEWSDHVFQTGYRLKSLAEVQAFIRVNKHLPGVLSAREMVERGNDLQQTDAKLLEKIEELTLYSIELENKLQDANRQYQREINELKQKQARLEKLIQQVLEQK